MKQIDKTTEKRLRWLFVPLIVVGSIIVADLLFDLNFKCEIWGTTALLICFAIALTGYCIAAIKQRCWGQLIVFAIITLLLILNVNDWFIDLLI